MSGRERRVSFVTGGAQGIGYGIARRLLRDGWEVVLADLDREAGREATGTLSASGPVHYVYCDVSDEDAVSHALSETLAHTGRLDGLVNNAGVAAPHSAPVESLALDDWRRVLDTNLTGAFLCAKHAAPHLRAHGGAIVNIASTRAIQSEPHSEAYAASKGGLVALTHARAISLGPAVRVNAVSPGWIDVSRHGKQGARTPEVLTEADHAQHPAGRVGRPEDVGALAAFLLSEDAAFITGQNYVADGGMTRKMVYVE